jgi:hypothetical protein
MFQHLSGLFLDVTPGTACRAGYEAKRLGSP